MHLLELPRLVRDEGSRRTLLIAFRLEVKATQGQRNRAYDSFDRIASRPEAPLKNGS
jgi:hypothetical protein